MSPSLPPSEVDTAEANMAPVTAQLAAPVPVFRSRAMSPTATAITVRLMLTPNCTGTMAAIRRNR